MPEFFAQPDDLGPIYASELHTSLGERLGAEAGEAFMGGARSLARIIQYDIADTEGVPGIVAPEVPIADARARIKQEGLEGQVKLPDQPTIRQPVLDLMVQHGHERADYDAKVSRGPQGFVPDALGFVTQIGAGMIDPVNAAAFSVPVLGEARYGQVLARAGDSIMARAGVAGLTGAAQGAVGSAALAPADWWLHTLDGQDYTMADALHSVVMGAGMGGAFHMAGRAIGDVRARFGGEPLPGSPEDIVQRALGGDEQIRQALISRGPSESDAERAAIAQRMGEAQIAAAQSVAHPATILADLPARVREDVVRAAIADVVNDQPVRAGEMLRDAAAIDPRIAESVPEPPATAAVDMTPRRRKVDEEKLSLLPFLALRGGLKEPPDLRAIFDTNPFIPGFGRLFRKTGMDLDRAREAAVEAGYLASEGRGGAERRGGGTSTIKDLLAALHEENRGNKRYRMGHEPAVREGVEHGERIHIIEGALDQAFHDEGLPELTGPLRARVVEMLDREGFTDPLDAYEAAVMEAHYAGRDEGQELPGVSEAVPGWDVSHDAGTASRSGAEAAGDARPAGRGTGGAPRAARNGDRASDWQSVLDARRPADPDLAEASRAADDAPPLPSVDAERSLSALEKAAADADALWRDLEPMLSEEERTRFNDVLNAIDREADEQARMIREGAACLAMGIGLG